MARPPCRSLGQGCLIASREGLTLKGLLHPRRPGKHGATMCTLQVQEQDSDYDMEEEEEEAVYIRGVNTNEDSPNAQHAQHRPVQDTGAMSA